MMTERTGIVTLLGNAVTLAGNAVKAGDDAPDFTALKNDLSPFSLCSLKGKTVILLTVPSLDTPVCDTEIRRFNQEAGQLSDVEVVVVSVDLPFAQARWCGATGADHVLTVSDHAETAAGLAYGVLIKEARLLARAAFVISPAGKIVFERIVPEVAEEPDYAAVLTAVKAC
ncbi:MAG: thiol peroxidase [Lentisphaeria bacterium]|nr:thiol peroxidase [Lentisphaeria bacterium]